MQIAKYFATFGIKVDQKSLDRINTILKKLEGYAKKYHAKIDSLEDKTTNRKVKNLQKVAKFQNQKMDEHIYAHKKHLDKINKEEERAAKRKAQTIRRIEGAVKYYSPSPIKRPMSPASASHSGMMGPYYATLGGSARQSRTRLNDGWLPSRGSGMRSQFASYYTRQDSAYRSRQMRDEMSARRMDSLHARALEENRLRGYNDSFAGRAANAGRSIGRTARAVGRGTRGAATAGFTGAGLLGLGAWALNATTNTALENESGWVKVKNAIKSVGGSDEEAKKRYREIVDYSRNIGINYLPVMGDYAKMISSGVGVKGANIQSMTETFKGFSNVASVFQLSPATANLFLRGVTQSLSKDQLMSEEYTGQILEHAAIGPAYQEAYRRMQKNKGIDVSPADTWMTMRKDMKAGTLSTLELNPFLLKVFEERYTPLLEENKKSLRFSRNNFSNTINEVFDPLLNPQTGSELKGLWNDLASSAKVLAPALLQLATLISENFTMIVEKAASFFGIDLDAQKRQSALALAATQDMENGIAVKPVYDYKSSGATMTMGIGGVRTPVSGSPIKWEAYKAEQSRWLKGRVYDYIPYESGSSDIDKFLSNPSNEAVKDFQNYQKSKLQGMGGSSDSATKSVIKDVKKYKMPYEFSQGSGQTVNINKVEITTRDANTLSTDLTKALMQFNGSEKNGMVG